MPEVTPEQSRIIGMWPKPTPKKGTYVPQIISPDKTQHSPFLSRSFRRAPESQAPHPQFVVHSSGHPSLLPVLISALSESADHWHWHSITACEHLLRKNEPQSGWTINKWASSVLYLSSCPHWVRFKNQTSPKILSSPGPLSRPIHGRSPPGSFPSPASFC